MENKTIKTTKNTTAKATAKTKLPPPPPAKVLKPKTETKPKVEKPNTEIKPKVEKPKAETSKLTEANISKVNLIDTKINEDFKIKKELPLWAYWVFIPLIFCMLLFIVVFAIGAAAYTG